MKKFFSQFFLRGLLAASGGPVVLAIVYGILGATDTVQTLTPAEVCKGIISITLLALFVGGMTAIYQIEKLPLVTKILVHGAGLYLAYILIYLINGWLIKQLMPIVIFTVIFVAGYALVWLVIYLFTKANTDKLNAKIGNG